MRTAIENFSVLNKLIGSAFSSIGFLIKRKEQDMYNEDYKAEQVEVGSRLMKLRAIYTYQKMSQWLAIFKDVSFILSTS